MFVLDMDAPADPRCLRLSQLSDCAWRLGMAFGEEAEQAQNREERIELFRLFDRCFFSVRVATALELRLARALRMSDRDLDAASDRDEDDEAPDWEEAPERFTERDREGDRETERASLPVLLRTLEGVAADAEARPGPRPAELPTLRELLAQAKSTPAAARLRPRTARFARSIEPEGAQGQGLRARLAGSAEATLAASPTPARRATGPPRR